MKKEFQQGLVDLPKKKNIKYTHVEFNHASIYTILLALVQDSSIEEVCMELEEVIEDWNRMKLK
jgi:hypothetical protein